MTTETEPAAGATDAYVVTATFEADAEDSQGNTWPGTGDGAYGEGGAGDGGVQARHLEGPAIAITGGHTYALGITGCSASGGGTYFTVRWYGASGLITSQQHAAWANCPTYQTRDWHIAAPAAATNVRLYFTYDNRYDDFRIQDLTALMPSADRVVLESDFEDGPGGSSVAPMRAATASSTPMTTWVDGQLRPMPTAVHGPPRMTPTGG